MAAARWLNGRLKLADARCRSIFCSWGACGMPLPLEIVKFTGNFEQSDSLGGSGSDGNPDTLRKDSDNYAPPGDVEALYRELDGAIVRRAEANGTLSVYAHPRDGRRALDSAVGRRRSGVHDLIVRAATTATRSDDIIASVEAWLADPGRHGRVIHCSLHAVSVARACRASRASVTQHPRPRMADLFVRTASQGLQAFLPIAFGAGGAARLRPHRRGSGRTRLGSLRGGAGDARGERVLSAQTLQSVVLGSRALALARGLRRRLDAPRSQRDGRPTSARRSAPSPRCLVARQALEIDAAFTAALAAPAAGRAHRDRRGDRAGDRRCRPPGSGWRAGSVPRYVGIATRVRSSSCSSASSRCTRSTSSPRRASCPGPTCCTRRRNRTAGRRVRAVLRVAAARVPLVGRRAAVRYGTLDPATVVA